MRSHSSGFVRLEMLNCFEYAPSQERIPLFTDPKRMELLIPTKNDLGGTLRVVSEAKVAAGNEPVGILVSVSDPNFWECHRRALLDEPMVTLLPPTGPLTLYENFRRLIAHSKADWISICADDDSIPEDFVEITNFPWPDSVNLVVPPIELRPYKRDTKTFGDEVISRFYGPKPGVDRVLLSAAVWPAWFFGVWRGSWLRQEFPEENFDWLDCAMLHKALLKESVSWAEGAQAMKCGYDPNRPRYAVSGAVHETKSWKEYCRQTIRSEDAFTKIRWRWLVEKEIEKTARRLNANVRSSR